MSKEGEIKSVIRSIAANSNSTMLFEAEITAVDGDKCSIKYQGLEHTDVRLVCGFTDSTKTILITPAVGSMALCVDLSNGKFRDIVVLMIEQTESIAINGGKNGGLINIKDLISKINTIENDLNNLKEVFSSNWTPVTHDGGAALKAAAASWAGQQIKKTKVSDIEDPLITH